MRAKRVIKEYRGIVARRISTIISRLTGLRSLIEAEPHDITRGHTIPLAVAVPVNLLEARKELPDSASSILRGIIEELIRLMPIDELHKAIKTPLEPLIYEHYRRATGSFRKLVSTLKAYISDPTLTSFLAVISELTRAYNTPCYYPRDFIERRNILERRMRIYGAILGLVFPLLFILTLLYNAVLVIMALAIAVGVWVLIRADGSQLRNLSIEAAWRQCTLSYSEILELLSGVNPTEAAILGLLFR
ncbi:MAG: hypothetical protein F7B95_03570 [Desulfurococcales archaeon]|nr:hypothetical protein [Desulfurococcales archaeon]